MFVIMLYGMCRGILRRQYDRNCTDIQGITLKTESITKTKVYVSLNFRFRFCSVHHI